MEQKQLALVGGVIVGIAAIGGVAFTLGLIPGTGSSGSTGSPPALNQTNTTGSNASLAFEITNFTECGRTCRIMKSSVTNEMNTSASNVTLVFDVYAGGNRTIWEGTKSIGAVSGGKTVTQSTKVKVSLQKGIQIQSNDGYVTVITTVYAGGEVEGKFRNRSKVA